MRGPTLRWGVEDGGPRKEMILALILLLSVQDGVVEWTPPITTSVSANPYVPFDPAGPEPGASVDAWYWSPTGRQRTVPCFWQQAGAASHWTCRFACNENGVWQRQAVAVDGLGTRSSPVSAFECTLSEGRGYAQVNGRSFEFQDGSPLTAPLVNMEQGNPFNTLADARRNIAALGTHGVRFIRWFPTGEGANWNAGPYGGDMRAWWAFGDAWTVADTSDGQRFSFKPYLYSSQPLDLPAGSYVLEVRGRSLGLPFTVDLQGIGGLTVTGPIWTTTSRVLQVPVAQETRLWLHGDGETSYVNFVSLRQGDGPNLLYRPDPNTYRYVDERSALLLDEIMRQSDAYGVYHKLPLFWKDDPILNRLDGAPIGYDDNFYNGVLAQWYEKAYVRYFLARWGVFNSLHSVELANENHFTTLSMEAGWRLADWVHEFEPRPVLVSNSFWGYFWFEFFADPRLDYGDAHRYARPGADGDAVSAIWDDSASYVRECQLADWQAYDRPVVRGEGGVWSADGFGQIDSINGEYYHDALWAHLGGQNCWGEWYPRVFPVDEFGLLDEFERYERFLNGAMPLGTLGTDLGNVMSSNPDLRAWGDSRMLWIDHVRRNWTHPDVPAVRGQITIPSMTGDYVVELTDLWTGSTRRLMVWGGLTFEVTVTRDVAVRIWSVLYLPLMRKAR